MESLKNMAVRVLGIAAVIMSFVFVGCTNEKQDATVTRSVKSAPAPTADPERYANYDFTLVCDAKESSFVHTGTSSIDIFVKGSDDAPENSFKRSLRSNCNISLSPDTVRISEGAKAEQTNVSIDRGFKGNTENDNVLIIVSDNRTLELPFTAEHASAERWMNVSYTHGHDSLISARLVKVENENVAVRTRAASSQYVKETYNTKYFVEVTTQAYAGDGRLIAKDLDTLAITGVTLVVADNNSSTEKTETGEKVLNETQQKDSVVITKTWDDGHSEKMNFNTILNRSLKNIEKREVIVPSFNDATYATSFSKVEGGEQLVRQDDNWTVYGREVVVSKMVSVADHTEEVRYTYYQERADFNYEGVSHSFGYIDWQISNYADDFKTAAVSTKDGYDELNYKNEIKTNYLGFVQMSNEEIAWFKEQIKVTGYGVINASRVDYTTYTLVSLEEVAYKSDGTQETVGKYSAKLPISVKPLTNWVLNEDVWGVYNSNDLATTLNSKSSETADKFFSYNQYVYNFSNEVAGQLNKGEASVPNDIVFNDGNVEYTFGNSDLKVVKKSDGTSFIGEDDAKTTYSYACIASVTFGESAQEVTLPGTINIAKAQVQPDPDPNPDPDPDPEPNSDPDPEPNNPVVHNHGKVIATYCTSTPNENRSYWYNVAVIQFEDGYRMVGMAENDAMEFNFTMSSDADVNSAVYTGGNWIPAKAEDNPGAGCMVWRDENGAAKRTLDYVTATRDGWNNGHNTVVDVRREGKISEDGYSVTFYLNGLAGQPMNF